METTPIVFNINAGALLVGIVVFFLALLGIIWKGKNEMGNLIDGKIGGLNKTIPKLTQAVVELQSIISNKIKGVVINQSLLETSGSPLAPTEYGAELIKKSGLEKILDDYKEDLCIKLKANLPKDHTEYDVQEIARNLLVSLKDDPMMKPIKEYLYNNPMDIELILRIGGLWLRDDFLKKDRKINKTKEVIKE